MRIRPTIADRKAARRIADEELPSLLAWAEQAVAEAERDGRRIGIGKVRWAVALREELERREEEATCWQMFIASADED